MPITLLYHDVVEGDDDASGFPGGGPARYKLEREEFGRHLDAIAATGVSLSPAEALEVPGASLEGDLVLISFDDGGVSSMLIAEMLEARGWRGIFFITVDYIGRRGFVDREQIRELARRGHTIGSHSCSHPDRMAACSREQLLDEWQRSCATLSEILGSTVAMASVPGGYYGRNVAEAAAAAGITRLFNSEPNKRVYQVDGCRVYGRYSVFRGDSARTAAALARGRSLALLKQTAAWNLKKVAKTIGGRAYLRVRTMLLNREQ